MLQNFGSDTSDFLRIPEVVPRIFIIFPGSTHLIADSSFQCDVNKSKCLQPCTNQQIWQTTPAPLSGTRAERP